MSTHSTGWVACYSTRLRAYYHWPPREVQRDVNEPGPHSEHGRGRFVPRAPSEYATAAPPGLAGEGVQRVRLRQALRQFQLLRERLLRSVWLQACLRWRVEQLWLSGEVGSLDAREGRKHIRGEGSVLFLHSVFW